MTSNYENSCGWTLDHIEPYLDDELGRGERARFERHVGACDTCAAELRFAQRVVGELRSLPTLRAAEHIDAVPQRAGAAATLAERVREWLGEGWTLLRRPAMATMLVVILAAGAFVITEYQRTRPPAVSQAEIEQAAQETMLAFAYVGKYSRRTGVLLRDQVIEGYVVEPVERAIAGSGLNETNDEHKRSDK